MSPMRATAPVNGARKASAVAARCRSSLLRPSTSSSLPLRSFGLASTATVGPRMSATPLSAVANCAGKVPGVAKTTAFPDAGKASVEAGNTAPR